jgi:hypothetical protein
MVRIGGEEEEEDEGDAGEGRKLGRKLGKKLRRKRGKSIKVLELLQQCLLLCAEREGRV